MSMDMAMSEEREESGFIPPQQQQQQQPQKRVIVKNADLTLQVSNVTGMCERIQLMVPKLTGGEGWISEVYVEHSGTASFNIRVPSTDLESFLSRLKCAFCEDGFAGDNFSVKVVSERTHGQDFTEEYYDLQSRIKSLETTRDQFYKVLLNATTTLDVLAVHRELESLNERIERIVGRKKYLENSCSMSTVHLNLSPLPKPYEPPTLPPIVWRPVETIKRAVRSLVITCIGIADFLIQLVIFAIPLCIVGVILFFFLHLTGSLAVLRKISFIRSTSS